MEPAFAHAVPVSRCARRRPRGLTPAVPPPHRVDALFGRGPRRGDPPPGPPDKLRRGVDGGREPQEGEDEEAKSPEVTGWFPGWRPRPGVERAAERGGVERVERDLEEAARQDAAVEGEAERRANAEAEQDAKAGKRFNPLDALFGDDAKREEKKKDVAGRRPLFPWKDGDKAAEADAGKAPAAQSDRPPVGQDRGKGEEGVGKDGDGGQAPQEPGEDIWEKVANVIVPNRNRKPADEPASPRKRSTAVGGRNVRVTRAGDDGPHTGGGADRPGIGNKGGKGRGAQGTQKGKAPEVGGVIKGVLGRIPVFRKKSEGDSGRTSGGARGGDAKKGGFDIGDWRNAVIKRREDARSAAAGSARPGDESRMREGEKGTDSGENGDGDDESKKSPDKKDTAKPLSGGIKSRTRRAGRVTVAAGSPMDISSVPQTDVAAIRNIFGSETFFATETLSPPGGLIFRGNLRGEPQATLAKLEERLHDRLGDKYTLCLAEGEEDLRPVVVVVPTARDRRPASPRQRLFSFAIAGLTLSTCYARAVYANWQVNEFRMVVGATPERVMAATGGGWVGMSVTRVLLSFPVASVALTIALVVIMSQLAQRWMARRHRTRMSLPYMIPSYQLGSFGALVHVASPTPTRAALFDIALAGAATLFLISLGLLAVGLRLSLGGGALVMPVPTSMLSGSMLIGWAAKMASSAGPGALAVHAGSSLVGLHPAAVVGANCLTIAALNLLPLRQLDGGRIVSAIYGRKTGILASRVTIFFLLLASSKSNYLFVFLALILFGPWNVDRPAKNELTEPNAARALLGYLFHLLMLAVLLPYPGHGPYKL